MFSCHSQPARQDKQTVRQIDSLPTFQISTISMALIWQTDSRKTVENVNFLNFLPASLCFTVSSLTMRVVTNHLFLEEPSIFDY